MKNLKPCPFCGEMPECKSRGGYTWIVCSCGIETKKYNNLDTGRVVEMWNRRCDDGDVCVPGDDK